MSCRAGFVWDTSQPFIRYIEDSGIACELVTPYMLAAPYYRGSFNCLIIPTGFANPAYCHLLPALRASAGRIRRFVEAGGNLLVFGAAIEKPGVYDWLPFPLEYHFDIRPRKVTPEGSSSSVSIMSDYNPACIESDGVFGKCADGVAATCEDRPVLIEKKCGRGTIIVTTIHEYPSRNFLKEFCASGTQTLF